MKKGIFIVLEGIDGVGKTTQLHKLEKTLKNRSFPVHITREPSSYPIGQWIRQSIRDSIGQDTLDWRSMALLFAADRMQHIQNEILPHLHAGDWVICDRYDASNIAYQSAMASDENKFTDSCLEWIALINHYALRPDITFVFDLDPDLAAQRRALRNQSTELLESISLQKKVREHYQKLHLLRPDDCIVSIDASRSIEEVHQDILNFITQFEVPNYI